MASVARYCCCDVGCPDQVEITISGVDAAACTGCNTDGVFSWKVISLGFDGVYVVSKSLENASICQYLVSTSVSFNSWEEHSDTTCTSLSYSGADSTRVINVVYDKVSGLFSAVNISGRQGFFGRQIGFGFRTVSTGAFGDTINNALTCTDSNIDGTGVALSNGGTATVVRA